MAAYPHVAEWARDFEMQYGSRPIYYGPLDRDAKKQRLEPHLRHARTDFRSHLRAARSR